MKFDSLDKILDDITREKNKHLQSYVEKFSLGNGQFQILNEIAWNDGISQEAIAEIRKINKSAIAKSVKGLIEKGYVYRERNEKDKRAFCLHCTEKGKRIIPEIKHIIDKVDNKLLKDFTEEEINCFRKYCIRVKKNITENK